MTEGTTWSWDEAPDRETVKEALATLPDVHGVPMVNVLDHTISIPNKEKVKDEAGRNTGEYKTTWKLYVQVAGREAQLWQANAIEDNGWRSVEFVPEVLTPGDLPTGIINVDPWVYREAVVIRDEHLEIMYRTSGTSKFYGGDYPWEKAETAARGRALGSLGFGVLPGSGIASAEEMQDVNTGPPTSSVESGPDEPQTDEEKYQRFMERREQYRQAKDMDAGEANETLAAFVTEKFGTVLSKVKVDADHPAEGPVDFNWSELTPGEVTLLTRSFETQLRRLSEESKIE